MGLMKLLGTSFSTILNGGNPTADRTVTFPDASGEALLVGRALTLMTAQNSTSGTSIDFTGIPSWAKKITVMFSGVSTSGTSVVQVQLGTNSGIETTGYDSTTSSAGGTTTYTNTGLAIGGVLALSSRRGFATINKLQNNEYVHNSIVSTETAQLVYAGGSKTLSGTLDRIRITTVNGTDTFDAGSINVMYEG